ncbi:hypothetical protein F511_28711 [Dorcoceras hygrometricum]|uniref:Dystroglycan-like n=1 Tax=Dorcoceras hygrometricum TaxID=472368 RepID=A0A2Z7AML4_9LAMI|nr:hypothetical protein F511_28711 [Dorcoceras hygrometricum]
MASSLFVNTLQVNFDFALTMEHNGMIKMFISLEESGLKEFLEASDSIFEEAVVEFFANSKVIAGTIVSLVGTRKIAITKDMFAKVFWLPSEGLTNFLNIPEETVTKMRSQFSGSDEPFRSPNKKKGMKIEFRLLHDVIAKALCTKAGSFDQVTSEKLDMMIAITVGLKVNWAQVLFQVLLNMVNTPKRQWQGFSIQISALLQNIVKGNLGESVKFHPQKVLTSLDRPKGPGSNSEHSVHVHHRDFIVTPIADQIGPIDSVSETEHNDLKNHFSEPQCKKTVLPLNSGKPRTCVTINGPGIQLAVGPRPLWLRNHNSGLVQRIMVKRLATSPHNPLGITDSACKNKLVVVSVQYGPFNPYIPIRSTTIVDWTVKMRIRSPELETSICDANYHVSMAYLSSSTFEMSSAVDIQLCFFAPGLKLFTTPASLASGSSCRLIEQRLVPFQAQRLIFSVKSKRCRVKLFKRHRFVIVLVFIVPADLSSSADHDVVIDDIIIDGPFRCSSWFPFDVPAGPSSSFSACSWFIFLF